MEMPGGANLIEYYAQIHRSRIYGTSSVKSLRFR